MQFTTIVSLYNGCMSRLTRSVISDPKRRSMISFRQYLMPKETDQMGLGFSNGYKVDPGVLLAVGDQSFSEPSKSLVQKIIGLYKWFGFVIRPDSLMLLGWYVVQSLIIIYYVLEVGLIFAFGDAFWQDELQALLGLQIAFIIILSVDILISPLKAYYQQGLLIKDLSLMFKHYVKVQLWVDLVGVCVVTVPLAVGAVQANWIKILWFCKFYTFGKMLAQFQRITQLYIVSNTILLVIKLVIYAYFYSNFMGIFFYKISLWIYNNNYYGPNTPNITWVYNSWAFYQMAFLPWYEMYTYIIYFSIAVVTTIAYGDITPKNPIECIYIIWALIFQTIIWGYIISQILRLLINVYSYNFERRYHHYSLNFKLKKNMVSDRTFQKVQQHTEEIDRDQQYRNRKVQESILQFLPPDPLYGLLLVTYRDFLIQLGFSFADSLSYKSLGPAESKSLFLQSFMKLVSEQRFFAGDMLYEEGEVEGSIVDNHCGYYFTSSSYSEGVALGVGEHLQIRCQDDSRPKFGQRSFQLKRPKRCFGQLQFLTGQQRSNWAICTRNCLLFVVPRSAMLRNYQLLSQEEKEYLSLNREQEAERSCFICKKNHFFKRCPFVFAASWQSQDICVKVGRRLKLRVHDRTRLRSLSSWRIFSTIRGMKMAITWQYKRRLFYERGSHGLFVELQLQQTFEQDSQDLQEEIQETEVIIENVYRQELQELGINQEEWTSDQVRSFSVYKPEGNVERISAGVQSKRAYRRNRRQIQRFQ